MPRPSDSRARVIGISSQFDPRKGRYACRPAYVKAIRRAGGLPVVLPYLAETAEINQFLRLCDGLVFPGGDDAIDPARFGQRVHPKVTWINPERDEFEIRMVQAAIAMDLPVLGICRGMQLLNVALGGTLCQHLLDERPGVFDHCRDAATIGEVAHEVEIHSRSRLGRITGSRGRAQVNSCHYQGIDAVAPRAEVSAVAPDGTIEAIEVPGCGFAVGVQWHPEELAGRDGMSEGLFGALVAAAYSGRPNQRSENAPPATSSRTAPPANAAVTPRSSGRDERRVPRRA